MFERLIKLKTLLDVLNNSQREFGNKDFLKYRIDEEFTGITFNQFAKYMDQFAGALYDIGVRKNDKVGIISENMYKWLIADMAIISLGAVDVPRGSDSTALEIEYILRHSDSKYCFVENPDQLVKIIPVVEDIPRIKHIILFNGSIKEGIKKIPKSVNIYHFDELLKKGEVLFKKYEKKIIEIRKKIKETDIVTIIYTSGTTGRPKGVMLLHKNIMQNIKALPQVIHIGPDERWLSVLPVWHVFERTLEYIIMATYGSMAYSKPTAKYLLPDFAEIKPTFMVSVPRIFEAIYQGIINKVKKDGGIKWILFKFFLTIGINYTQAMKILKNLLPVFEKPSFFSVFFNKIKSLFIVIILWCLYQLGDVLVYKNIRLRTGGKLRGPISGGGALPEYVDKFFCAIKLELLEGWGLTETAPVIGVRLFERLVPRTVGPPSPGIKIMIGDEKGKPLSNQHEKGIVYIKGDNVMPGYYKDPKKTKEVFTKDGWFNTGDLGRLTLNGELQLTGRAKDTIVLTGGENIEPCPIEDKLLEHPLIHQVMVVGQDQKVLGALIIPSEENLIEFVKKKNINYTTINDLCSNEDIINKFREIVKSKINIKNGFKDFERVVHIVLIPTPFEVGVELTHSLKMRRNVISEKYENVINKMFFS